MLKHIVSMRMKADNSQDRAAQVEELSAALTGLVGKVEQIRSLAVERNVVERPGNWDLALIVDFDSADDLEIYRAHPDHVKVIELINVLVADRCAVDFVS